MPRKEYVGSHRECDYLIIIRKEEVKRLPQAALHPHRRCKISGNILYYAP